MPLNVSPPKPFKYPLLMLGQHLHRWLRRHRGRSTGPCSRIMRGPSPPLSNPAISTFGPTETDVEPCMSAGANHTCGKSKLDIHSRLAFRACRPLTVSESPLGGVGQKKQLAKQRLARLSVSCNDCR